MRNSGRRCGFVALVGKPNVGKSTLFNRLLGAHLAAVTHKPQTTRYNLRGVLTRSSWQMVFLDTPGLHARARRPLNRFMNANALGALEGADVVVMISTYDRWSSADEIVLKAVRNCRRPTLLVLNKIDRARDKGVLLEALARAARRYAFKEIFPLSALRDAAFDRFTDTVAGYLPRRDFIFSENQVSDRSERFITAELIREQLMLELHQELPYVTHVEIERFEERASAARVSAVIFVERSNQRAIVIGRGGVRLKRIGTRARRKVERLLGRRVFMQLWVKARGAWQRDPSVFSACSGGGPPP